MNIFSDYDRGERMNVAMGMLFDTFSCMLHGVRACLSDFTCLPLELCRPKRPHYMVMQCWPSERQCMHSC